MTAILPTGGIKLFFLMICFSKIISEGVFIMDQQKIGRFISELRKELGMTQTELGEKLGVSYKAVSKWETGGSLR